MWNYWFSPNNVILEGAFERSDFPFWGSLKFWMFSETYSTFSCLNSNCWNLRPFTHQNLKNQWDKTTWKSGSKSQRKTQIHNLMKVSCARIYYIYIWIQYIWHTAKTKITTYHSSDRAIVKSQRKVPQFMTLENAYISFVENNVKETYKTF